MEILLIEPFFSGSHRQWAEGYQQHSQHAIKLLTLPGRHWKWRMYGGAVALAKQFRERRLVQDLLLVTDMLDLTTFQALTKDLTARLPVAVYFHENQITYPWSPSDRDAELDRNNQYGFINYTSALSADRLFFNSNFHMQSFLSALPGFLSQFPDQQGQEHIAEIANKSQVLPLGMNLKQFDAHVTGAVKGPPVILWNHRWEYDKDPETFFRVVSRLVEEGMDFRLILLGENFRKVPEVFNRAKERFTGRIIHAGYTSDFQDYARYLWQADILPVTSRQDFFGGSVVEAVYCNCFPILPQALAFPEHLPEAVHERHFYSGEEALYQKLKWAVGNIEAVRRFSGRQYIGHYDWGAMAAIYDKAFSTMAGC